MRGKLRSLFDKITNNYFEKQVFFKCVYGVTSESLESIGKLEDLFLKNQDLILKTFA